MSRSGWKVPHINSIIIQHSANLQKIIDLAHRQDPAEFIDSTETVNKILPNKYIVTSRDSAIPRSLLGSSVQVYNGQKYISFKIENAHLGKKFGEFSHSRKILSHKEVKKKQIQKK